MTSVLPNTDSGATAQPADAAARPLLEVDGLSIDVQRSNGPLRLVGDVSFRLDAGRTLGIVGESGSGKSVTAMSLMRLLPNNLSIASGTVRFDGRDLATLSEPQLRKVRGNDIGVVFQDPQNSLNPAFTIGNQMVETLRAHSDLSRGEAKAKAVSLLDRVGIHRAASRINDYPHQMSGGMAQRVMIAMAISLGPKLLIADEPTTALDVTVQAQILALLRSIQDETGMSLLIISHDLSVIAETADQVAVMYGGQIVERGDVVEVLTAPTHPYTEALLAAQPESTVKGEPLATIEGIVPNADAMPHGCRFNPRCAYALDICRDTEPPLVEVAERRSTSVRCVRHEELQLRGVGVAIERGPADAVRSSAAAAGTVLLEADSLSRVYGLRGGRLGRKSSFHAVDDVSFVLREGETLGVVGESGAGKSTVGRMVLGLTPTTSGTVRFGGSDIATQRGEAKRATRRDIQVVFQNPYASLDSTMSIGESVAEPLEVHHRGTKTERTARVAELLQQVGLDPSVARRRPHELSGGQRQRVAIARGLALNPRLIVCDEPVSALDVSTQAQVINLLRDLQQRFGIAYLFVGHDLSVVYQVSDRIAVMYHGRIVEMGPADEVYHAPKHPYTVALLDAVLSIDPRHRRLDAATTPAAGEPSATGCAYANRCPHVMAHCRTDVPMPVEVPAAAGLAPVTVRCHLFDGSAAQVDS
ncbi:MAG: dipeptide transporter ATP-binding protein [Ilumatobacteraceae bacterium]|nr:dipeptide transporter ATP-binding protein [Ilumatobacteraceae bacterium]